MDPIYPWWCWLQPSSARLTNCGLSSLMNWRIVALPFAYIWENWNVTSGLKNNSENLCQETPVVKVRAEGECRVQGTHHHLESSPEFKNHSQINLKIPPSQWDHPPVHLVERLQVQDDGGHDGRVNSVLAALSANLDCFRNWEGQLAPLHYAEVVMENGTWFLRPFWAKASLSLSKSLSFA